jgi:SpoVK/Ycf46/Vps4 family AAA+-type ATPase
MFQYAHSMQTEGCSGAELTALCQEAAMLAMKADIRAAYVGPNHKTDASTTDPILRFHTLHSSQLRKLLKSKSHQKL